jgi:23S rRNA pseudouridine1911/1915/1917 synthase
VPRQLRAVQTLDRPFLHASRLSFAHPGDGRRLEFRSELPANLADVVERLRHDAEHLVY